MINLMRIGHISSVLLCQAAELSCCIMNIVLRFSRVWRQQIFILIALSLCLSAAYACNKEVAMTNALKLNINRKPVSLTPAPRLKNGEALVPLQTFSKVIGAEVKTIEAGKKFSVCKGDICILLDVSSEDVVSINDVVYFSLAAFAEPLGLQWRIEDDTLKVISPAMPPLNKEGTERSENLGLGIGAHPPDFTLADIYTEDLVSLKDYLGKKTVFFMWASW
jgi:hypothetical protein